MNLQSTIFYTLQTGQFNYSININLTILELFALLASNYITTNTVKHKICLMQQQLTNDPLNSFWKNEELYLFVSKQIKATNLKPFKVTDCQIYLIHHTPNFQSKNNRQTIRVIISLGKGFPVTSPQILFLDSFSSISLKGYRDFLKVVIGKEWSYHITLKQIVEAIDEFVRQFPIQKDEISRIQRLGHYHINRVYDYSILKQLSDKGAYFAFQIEEDAIFIYVIVLTSFHFILFKPFNQPYLCQNKLVVPKQTEVNSMKIEYIAELHGLYAISHCRTEKNQYLISFFGEETRCNLNSFWRKKMRITRSTQFIQSLIKSLKNYRGNIEIEADCIEQNSEQQHLVREMRLHQQKISHYFNKDSINELNQCYQKLVEYYSSVGLPYQQVYLRKIASLFNRQDVMLVMSQSEIIRPTKI